MKKMGFSIFMGLILCCSLAFGQEVYRWVDEKGTVHFTDDLGQVPEKYLQKSQPLLHLLLHPLHYLRGGKL
jgi:hypothetical protein